MHTLCPLEVIFSVMFFALLPSPVYTSICFPIIEGIKEIFVAFGVYDILVKAEAENFETLRDTIITWKIRKIPGIRSTLTLMTIVGQE